ncbi:hypothetical protein EX30DRAFT_392031 [Ascodesmis nigricans]|uniref:Prokaryotic-type class I peptide chain release factors domain-containing protein n=1 Tax=Ascodesmis nigricans TaxID=341454 RepID=A0A4S2N5V5_9PEZI|nr:hypothetical protein EX30DRAFT_392031 [Ascodesmis nigricans]
MSILARQLRLFAPRPFGTTFITSYSTWREEIAHKWKNQEEIDEARKWLDSFQISDIPRKQCKVTFAASSGPGGQHVNRSSTKATLHFELAKAAWLPSLVLKKVRENSHHLTKHDAIIFQSDETRSQHENMDKVFEHLYNELKSCVSRDVPGETSPEKHERVMKLQKAEREERKRIKNFQKAKKDARRGRGSDLG